MRIKMDDSCRVPRQTGREIKASYAALTVCH
jgi:hypothetical protein